MSASQHGGRDRPLRGTPQFIEISNVFVIARPGAMAGKQARAMSAVAMHPSFAFYF
jgi:hypothetical protein